MPVPEGASERAAAVAEDVADALTTATPAALGPVRDRLDQALEDGLRARLGFLLLPPAGRAGVAVDLSTWRLLLTIRAALARRVATSAVWSIEGQIWSSMEARVCESCTLVFAPQTTTAVRCDLCRKRGAGYRLQREGGTTQTGLASAGGIVLSPAGSLPTEAVIPRFAEDTRQLTGWGRATFGRCPGCGEPFSGRSDAQACQGCAPRLNTARSRAKTGGR